MKKLSLLTFLILFSANLSAEEKETEEPKPIPQEKPIPLSKIDPARFFDVAKIQILDKTTAKSVETEIKTGESYDFGNIKITIHKCWQAPLDQKPNSKILMEVSEKTPITTKKNSNQHIFRGWMISDSPSVSGLEHPVYDIVALQCLNPEPNDPKSPPNPQH